MRADKAHERLVAMGYMGSERTTRRAVDGQRENRLAVDHVCGIAVRNPQIVAVGRHYGISIAGCSWR
jgi:hypothetical protein